MNTADIKVIWNTEDLNHLIKHYHFREEDFGILQALSQVMTPLLQARAYYVWKKKGEIVSYEDYAVVFLTLGDGVDALQEVYLGRQCLSEAYMVECIALEMLMKAYEEFVKQVQRETGKWAVKIDFLGDTYPMELLPELYDGFDSMEITYNEKLVLSPGKSVVFLLPMSEKKTKNPCHICENCSNKECIFRTESHQKEVRGRTDFQRRAEPSEGVNTYGYQRIFGNKL